MNKQTVEKYKNYLFPKTSPLYLYEAIARCEIENLTQAISKYIYNDSDSYPQDLKSVSGSYKDYATMVLVFSLYTDNVEVVKLVYEKIEKIDRTSPSFITSLAIIRKNNLSLELYEFLYNKGCRDEDIPKDLPKDLPKDIRPDIKKFYDSLEKKKDFIKVFSEGSEQEFQSSIMMLNQYNLTINTLFADKTIIEYAIDRSFFNTINLLLVTSDIKVSLKVLELAKSDEIFKLLCDYFFEMGSLQKCSSSTKNSNVLDKVMTYLFERSINGDLSDSNKRSRS
jgi:hypothetical protein